MVAGTTNPIRGKAMEKLPYLPPQINSLSGSGASTTRLPEMMIYASERARLLFGQYRKGDANDPETYVASIAAILSDYPAETIRYVTDPRSGIAANPLSDPETGRVWTGMPDAANVKRACELHYAPTRKLIERQAQARQQLEERDQLAIPDRSKRKTYEQLQVELAEVGIFIGAQNKPINIDEFRAKHGISKEQWDAIPNTSHVKPHNPQA